MRFKGQLLIPAEKGPGLPVDLEVTNRQLAVVADSEELGCWPLGSVRVRRIDGNRFKMTVAGEDLHFVAEDTLSFAYDGIQAIEQKGGISGLSILRNLRALFGLETSTEARETPVLHPHSETTSSAPLRLTEIDVSGDTPRFIDEHGYVTEEARGPTGDPSEGHPDLSHTQPADLEAREIDLSSDGHSPRPFAGEDVIELDEEYSGEPSEDRCRALRNDGQPCESPIIGESGYCYPHDPDNPVGKWFHDAQKARSRLKRKRAKRLSRVYSRLDKALKQVERGEMDTEQAMAMAQLARTMCAILELDDDETDDKA